MAYKWGCCKLLTNWDDPPSKWWSDHPPVYFRHGVKRPWMGLDGLPTLPDPERGLIKNDHHGPLKQWTHPLQAPSSKKHPKINMVHLKISTRAPWKGNSFFNSVILKGSKNRPRLISKLVVMVFSSLWIWVKGRPLESQSASVCGWKFLGNGRLPGTLKRSQ